MTPGSTHWEECWRSHPECAYARGRREGIEEAAKMIHERGLEVAAQAVRALTEKPARAQTENTNAQN